MASFTKKGLIRYAIGKFLLDYTINAYAIIYYKLRIYNSYKQDVHYSYCYANNKNPDTYTVHVIYSGECSRCKIIRKSLYKHMSKSASCLILGVLKLKYTYGILEHVSTFLHTQQFF